MSRKSSVNSQVKLERMMVPSSIFNKKHLLPVFSVAYRMLLQTYDCSNCRSGGDFVDVWEKWLLLELISRAYGIYMFVECNVAT